MIKAYFVDVRKFDNQKFLSEVLNNASLFRIQKYESYRFESSKKQSIAVAYLIDEYLKTIGLREKDMIYEYNKFGKPSIMGHEEINFCLSHSDNLAMAVFSDIAIGCDIQKISDIDDKLIDMVLSDFEKKEVLSCSDKNAKNDTFFKYWVTKEAIVKRMGTGLSSDIKEIKSEGIYLDTLILHDIGEKYYYAIDHGIKEITKIDMFMI